MATLYCKTSAEFIWDIEEPESVADAINNGNRTLSVVLKEEKSPLLYVRLEISPHGIVEGEFSAKYHSENRLQIKLDGVFSIDVKPEYKELALSKETMWIIAADEVIRGVTFKKYEDYYGTHEYSCLDIVVGKSKTALNTSKNDTR